jgi:hypothetical protein
MQFLQLLGFLFPFFLFVESRAQNSPLEWKKGEDLFEKTAKYLFLKVSVNKKEAFIGESILARYQLYVAVNIQGKLAKAPSYRGFAAYDMQNADNESYTVENLQGINYRVYLIKTVQLFGLKSGTQILEPVELDATVQYRFKRNESNDNILSFEDTLYSYTAKSQPLGVKINPLPKNPAPEKHGGVGKFEFLAEISQPVIEANKADTLALTLTGNGSWHQIALPAVEWPAGLEVFEPAIKETLDPLALPVEGIRTLQYPVVCSKPGKYVIPPLKFTYFDPEKKLFSTLETDSIRWTVIPAIGSSEAKRGTSSGKDLTALFSRFALVLFPLTAVLLVLFVFFRKRKTKANDLDNNR